jgi:hypothetical protein
MLEHIWLRRFRRVAVLIFVVSLWATGAWGQGADGEVSEERRAATRAAARASTKAVVARIVESADYLAARKRFAFRSRNTFEVLQVNDQMLEFGATQTVTVRRPDRARIESQDRNGESRVMTFDGKTIAIDLPEADAYIAVEKPGSLNDAVEYLVDDLGTPAPLHEFMTDNYFDDAQKEVLSAYWVDTEQIGEQLCDHLAVRGANVDIELWIRDGDQPLPCRIVIRHVAHPGEPEFTSEFESWDLDPKVPDEMFSFEAPKGAERLTLQAGKQMVREGRGKP